MDSDFIGKSGMTKYGDSVMETDWSVGQILKALDSQHPDIVNHLTKLMEQYIASGRSTPGISVHNEVKVGLWKKETYIK